MPIRQKDFVDRNTNSIGEVNYLTNRIISTELTIVAKYYK